MTNSTTSQKRPSSAEKLSDVWIAALFKKLQARYGHKWSTAIEGIEKVAVNEWAEGLAGLSGDQIKHGLDNWNESWPPSMPEFKNVCLNKGINEFGLDYVPECYRETKRERLIESDENKAKHKAAYESGMKGIKDVLKG